jgi:hypothetical protein
MPQSQGHPHSEHRSTRPELDTFQTGDEQQAGLLADARDLSDRTDAVTAWSALVNLDNKYVMNPEVYYPVTRRFAWPTNRTPAVRLSIRCADGRTHIKLRMTQPGTRHVSCGFFSSAYGTEDNGTKFNTTPPQ